ncbi:hypothetical protein BSKO_08716 [Bryopsis sp. KO-2023]|nr:hypothetical protein BSKO_08716 [Bryopsis sp. KO-2023]
MLHHNGSNGQQADMSLGFSTSRFPGRSACPSSLATWRTRFPSRSVPPSYNSYGARFPQRKDDRGVCVGSFRGNGRVTKLGFLEVEDEGFDIVFRAKGLEFKVKKTEAWKYATPVAGLAAIGVAGAIFIGPLVLSLLFAGGLFLASVSAFSALLVATFLVPVAAVVLVTATSAVGSALTLGLTVGTIGLLVWGVTMVFSKGAIEEVEVQPVEKEPEKEDWVEEMENMKRNIDADLKNFDRRLKDSEK